LGAYASLSRNSQQEIPVYSGLQLFFRAAGTTAMNKSEAHRIIEHEDERLAGSTGISVRLTRRALLVRAAALAAAWTISPWQIGVPSAFGQETDQAAMWQTLEAYAGTPGMTQTLEAYADTLIPGQKRFPGDRAIAGVVSGAGAVQAGAIEMMNFPPVGLEAALPLLALSINVNAVVYAVINKITLDLTVPPFVSLDFASRTALLVNLLETAGPEQGAFYGLAAISFAAYNTAGYLPTVVAIQDGHPGLAAIGFPPPNPDGLWRFPEFSYRRVLARAHPHSQGGNPA
jgi:enediyne biosynthesis protein E8